MKRLWNSVALRLSLIGGSLVVIAVLVLSSVFYFGTARVLAHAADEKIATITERLVTSAETSGRDDVVRKIQVALTDSIDYDTEIYLLASPSGKPLAGNIVLPPNPQPSFDRVIDLQVLRYGRPVSARVLLHRLPDGALLIVGRNMSDLLEIDALVWRAIGIGALLALGLSVAGTLFFRARIEERVGAIRHAAMAIEAGDLKRRIEVSGDNDEFARLGHDLNRMLSRLEQLMDGVQHVSNMIAHNLRTPLGHIRNHLEMMATAQDGAEKNGAAAETAIEEIDRLIRLFNSLLQIAEADSGARRQCFAPVQLRDLVSGLIELYDAAAEERHITLTAELAHDPVMMGDSELLSSMLACLFDNAFKYAGSGARIHVRASSVDDAIILTVADNGAGIPVHERQNVLEPFYRSNDTQPGFGIGLSMVAAVVRLHHGTLLLEDARPGLLVRMTFPRWST